MKHILDEIQSGKFAEEWIAETRGGRENFTRLLEEGAEHQIEKVGAELRGMMPWISAGKQSVQDASRRLTRQLDSTNIAIGSAQPPIGAWSEPEPGDRARRTERLGHGRAPSRARSP